MRGRVSIKPTNLIEVEVLRMLRYCRMSGTVIRRRARRNRSPVLKEEKEGYFLSYFSSQYSVVKLLNFKKIFCGSHKSMSMKEMTSKVLHDVCTISTNIQDSYSHTYPGSVEVNGHKRRWDGEVIDEGVDLEHEPELVRGRNELG